LRRRNVSDATRAFELENRERQIKTETSGLMLLSFEGETKAENISHESINR